MRDGTTTLSLARRFVAADPLNHQQASKQDEQRVGGGECVRLPALPCHCEFFDGRAVEQSLDRSFKDEVTSAELAGIKSLIRGGTCHAIDTQLGRSARLYLFIDPMGFRFRPGIVEAH